MFGKIKTTCQMVLIIVSILLNLHVFSTWYMIVLSAATVLITLFSALDYFMKNRSVFTSR